MLDRFLTRIDRFERSNRIGDVACEGHSDHARALGSGAIFICRQIDKTFTKSAGERSTLSTACRAASGLGHTSTGSFGSRDGWPSSAGPDV